jgi:hypothetical protein
VRVGFGTAFVDVHGSLTRFACEERLRFSLAFAVNARGQLILFESLPSATSQ